MRVLMLHGYTESGDQFRVKLRRLEQRIESEYPNSYFHYPTGPINLHPQNRTEQRVKKEVDDEDEESSTNGTGSGHFAWFDHHSTVRPHPGYRESLAMLAHILRDHGPFDGVVAFSQGTILAGQLVSLLQNAPVEAAFDSANAAGVSHAPFPDDFRNLRHPSLKFAVLSGPMMSTEDYYSLFYGPHINRTSICHVMGTYDPVVDLEVTERVVKTFVGPTGIPSIITHPGAHFVPMGEKYINHITSFIRKSVSVSSEDIIRSLLKTSLCHQTESNSVNTFSSIRSRPSSSLLRQVKRRTANGRKTVSFFVPAMSRSSSSSSTASKCPHRNCQHCGSSVPSSASSDSDGSRMPVTPPSNDLEALSTYSTVTLDLTKPDDEASLERSIGIMAEASEAMEKALDVTYTELSPTPSLEEPATIPVATTDIMVG